MGPWKSKPGWDVLPGDRKKRRRKPESVKIPPKCQGLSQENKISWPIQYAKEAEKESQTQVKNQLWQSGVWQVVRKSALGVPKDGIECSWLSLLGHWGTECGWVGLAQRFLVGWTKTSSSSPTPAGWVPESHSLYSWVFLFLLFLRIRFCVFCFPVTEINTG